MYKIPLYVVATVIISLALYTYGFPFESKDRRVLSSKIDDISTIQRAAKTALRQTGCAPKSFAQIQQFVQYEIPQLNDLDGTKYSYKLLPQMHKASGFPYYQICVVNSTPYDRKIHGAVCSYRGTKSYGSKLCAKCNFTKLPANVKRQPKDVCNEYFKDNS